MDALVLLREHQALEMAVAFLPHASLGVSDLVTTLAFAGLGPDAVSSDLPCPLHCEAGVLGSCFMQAYMTFRILTPFLPLGCCFWVLIFSRAL